MACNLSCTFTRKYWRLAPAAGGFLCKRSYMADVTDRDELEAKLARKIGVVFGEVNKDFIDIFIDNDFDFRAPEVTKAYSKLDLGMRKAMAPALGSLVDLQAAGLADELGFPVDWKLINQGAANWAKGYSTILAGQVASSSRDRIATSVRGSIAAFYEEGLNLGELKRRLEADPGLAHLFTSDVKDKLGRVYGPGRAEMIARTELTRAAAEGERLVADQWIEKGHQLDEIWHTRFDEIVCPICLPRNKKKVGTTWTRNQGPPGHPRCRCWVTFTLPKQARQPKAPPVPVTTAIPRAPKPINVPGTGFTPAKTKKEALDRLEGYTNDTGFVAGLRFDPKATEIIRDLKKGVNFTGQNLNDINSVLKAIEDVATRYNVDFGYIGHQWKRRKSLGTYWHSEHIKDSNALAIQKSWMKKASVRAEDARDSFEYHISSRIRRLEEAIDDPRRSFLLARNEQELIGLKRLKRFNIYTEEGVDAIEAVARHEAYHGVYYQHDLEDLWIKALKKHGVTAADEMAVSEYATSMVSELFPEAASALDLGIAIPDNIRKAVLEVLEHAR